MKAKLNVGGLKELLALHIEKLLFGMVAATMLYIIYGSYSQKGIDTELLPDKLAEKTKQAEANMRRSSWQEVSATRSENTEDFQKQAMQNIKIDLATTDYHLNAPWNPLNFTPDRRRPDPKLLVVKDLQVHYIMAPAIDQMTGMTRMPGRDDPDKKKQGAIDLKSAEADAMGMTRMAEEWDPKTKKLIRRPLPDLNAERLRTLGPPTQAGGMMDTKAEGVRMVMLTGLVPYREQVKIYQETFKGTKGIPDPQRDFPNYFSFKVERAEIKPDGSEAKWEPVNAAEMFKKQQNWGPGPEFAPTSRVHPNLTFPLPNLLFVDLESIARHPGIPTPEEVANEEWEKQAREAREQAESEGKPIGPAFNPNATMDTAGPGAMGGMGGGVGGPGMMMGGGMGGYGRGEMGGGIGGPGMMMGGGMGGYGAMGGYGMGGYGRGGYGMGGRGGEGYGMAAASYGNTTPVEQLPEYLMLRFADYSVQPGRGYRYRVSLILNDPNNPDVPGGPDRRHLEDSVTDRLRENKKKGTEENPIFWVESDWSESSPAIYTDNGYEILAGSVNLSKEGPKANVMALKFDNKTGKEIPDKMQAITRGTVIGRRAPVPEPWALDPATMTLVKESQVDFRTGIQVGDIRGGEKLPSSGKDTLSAPGEILLITEDGRMMVRSELDDEDRFYVNDFPPPLPEQEKPPEEGGVGGMGAGGMGYGVGGYGGGGYGGMQGGYGAQPGGKR